MSSNGSESSEQEETWIQWFCRLRGHEFFCEVERAYIEDSFNLYGLRAYVSNFNECLDLILDRIDPDDSEDGDVTQSACMLYGMIHARYILTAHGLEAMLQKHNRGDFGQCPRTHCRGQPALPLGLKDEPRAESVQTYCPKCRQCYRPHTMPSLEPIDGAFFGSTFPHLFLMTFDTCVPEQLGKGDSYVPRVFGFRIHPSSRALGGSGTSPVGLEPGHGNGDESKEGHSEGQSAVAAAAAAATPGGGCGGVAAAARGGDGSSVGSSQKQRAAAAVGINGGGGGGSSCGGKSKADHGSDAVLCRSDGNGALAAATAAAATAAAANDASDDDDEEGDYGPQPPPPSNGMEGVANQMINEGSSGGRAGGETGAVKKRKLEAV